MYHIFRVVTVHLMTFKKANDFTWVLNCIFSSLHILYLSVKGNAGMMHTRR